MHQVVVGAPYMEPTKVCPQIPPESPQRHSISTPATHRATREPNWPEVSLKMERANLDIAK